MEIEKTLVVSTKHITQSTADWLAENASKADVGVTIDYGADVGVIIDYGLGYLFHPFEGYEEEHLPHDLYELVQLARKNDCTWLKLDSDGPVEDTLKKFDW